MIRFELDENQVNLISTAIERVNEKYYAGTMMYFLDGNCVIFMEIAVMCRNLVSDLEFDSSDSCMALVEDEYELFAAIAIMVKQYKSRLTMVEKPSTRHITVAAKAVQEVINHYYNKSTDWKERAAEEAAALGPIEQAIFAWSVM